MVAAPSDNAVIVEAWNTILFTKFTRYKHLLVAGLSGHSEEGPSLGTRTSRGRACSMWVVASATAR